MIDKRIRLGVSCLTNTVYAYIPDSKGNMSHQLDVTKDFHNINVQKVRDLEQKLEIAVKALETLRHKDDFQNIEEVEGFIDETLEKISMKKISNGTETFIEVNEFKKTYSKKELWKCIERLQKENDRFKETLLKIRQACMQKTTFEDWELDETIDLIDRTLTISGG